MNKILIGEGEFKGGLRESTQKYRINYMLPVYDDGQLKYSDKIEFAIITPSKEPNKENYHSLRFTSPEQIRVIIYKLIRAYAYFMKKKGILNINNSRTLPAIFQKNIALEFEQVLREVG